LLLLTERWDELDNLPVPDGISDSDKAAAQDALEFYRGLSLLARRQPGPAVDIFHRLHVRHREIPAYFTNLHAAKTLTLVIDNNFGFLDPDQREQARELIADGRRQVNSHRNLTETDRTPILLNSALLSLAIRRPKQALDLLSAVRSERPSETLYAYKALALHRLGNPGAALATLQEAENRLGKTQLVEAVANQIDSDTACNGPGCSPRNVPAFQVHEFRNGCQVGRLLLRVRSTASQSDEQGCNQQTRGNRSREHQSQPQRMVFSP
jgi:hypothetical protein